MTQEAHHINSYHLNRRRGRWYVQHTNSDNAFLCVALRCVAGVFQVRYLTY